jgi:hypothetical protein
MRFEPHTYDQERRATALRAFFVTLAFSLMALWAFGGAHVPAHRQGGLDRQPFDQGAKLAAAGHPRALGAKLERVKPKAHLALDLSSPILLGEGLGSAAPVLLARASWDRGALLGPDDDVHHYAATGPPGRQLS